MPTTPSWQAARNGLPGNLNATNASAQVNQLLGTHAITEVYEGNPIYVAGAQSSTTVGGFFWLDTTFGGLGWLPVYDVDQAFAMPTGQTAIGRIQLAMLPIGNGADVQVTLYPDSSGSPNLASPITSTVVPKEWITSLLAANGLTNPRSPLATAASNTMQVSGGVIVNWTQPAISGNGVGSYATPVTNGNYIILMGGYDPTASAASGLVATVQYLGGSNLSGPTPQPALPKAAWYGMGAATSSMIMFAGGTNGTSFLNNVWTASWSPNTGTVGAWTAQANLPVALNQGAAAAWGNTVYIIGGSTSGSASNAQSTVYYANATNGQISAWLTGPPLPQPLQVPFAAVIGNWLIVAGGQNTSGATLNTTYYAAINADGSLGAWQTGPSLPTGVYALGSGWNTTATDSAMIITSGLTAGSTNSSTVQVLTADVNGLNTWQTQVFEGATYQASAFPSGSPGQWEIFLLMNTSYIVWQFIPAPLISIPLPATGLTAGATYHLMFHQIGGDLNNYTQVAETSNSSQQWLYSTRYSGGPWTAHTGHGIMLNVFDESQAGRLLHTWEDSTGGLPARTSTLVKDWRGRLLGACEATALPNNPLDSNPYFTTGVAPWTAVGGTITQSNAQTHGGYPYSGLLTPNGTAATAYAQSEQIPITAGTWYTARAWVYTPTGWSTVSLSIIWYDQQGNVVTVYNNNLAVAAATWTQLTNTIHAPATAAKAALAPAEGGTPAAANTLYLSAVTLTRTDPSTLADVAQVTYGQALWPPTGVTQLA